METEQRTDTVAKDGGQNTHSNDMKQRLRGSLLGFDTIAFASFPREQKKKAINDGYAQSHCGVGAIFEVTLRLDKV